MRHKQAFPSKKEKRYRSYSPSSLTDAYRAVIEDNMSVLRAAKTYKVPETTLRQRVRGRIDPETTSSGPMPVLSQEEEAVFVEHLKAMSQIGYGYTRREVINMASNYATYLKKRDKDHPFSMRWFQCFMRRWPELGVNKPRPLSNYRAKATSPDVVNNYFDNLNEILIKHGLKNKPECLFNVDEKGIQTEHAPPFLVSAGRSTPAITASRTAITTILGCGNALGTMIPPFYIFKGKRMNEGLLEGSLAGSAGTVSESGWCNSSVFYRFLDTHFIKFVQRRSVDQPILLLLDGHKSHINIPVINWAKENNGILFVLPAHTSHILQPLDVACFGPLQKIYNSECHKYIRNNPSSTITRYSVAALSSKAYENALSPANLKSAFRRTGVFPFDISVIDPEQLAPSTAYADPSPDVNMVEVDHSSLNVPQPMQAEEPQDFFIQFTKPIEAKKNVEKKVRKGLHNIVGGNCVTEPEILEKIVDYQKTQKVAPPPKKSFKKSTTSIKKPAMNLKRDLIKPGPSGLQVHTVSNSSMSESDSDNDDDEICCACLMYRPKELQNCVSVVFTKWAQCDVDNCKHWTHLKYCCPETVIRLNDRFECPCHKYSEE